MAEETTTSKIWYKSKTIWFGLLTGVISLLVEFQVVLEQAEGVPGWLLGAVGAMIIVLRVVTGQPVSRSSDSS